MCFVASRSAAPRRRRATAGAYLDPFASTDLGRAVAVGHGSFLSNFRGGARYAKYREIAPVETRTRRSSVAILLGRVAPDDGIPRSRQPRDLSAEAGLGDRVSFARQPGVSGDALEALAEVARMTARESAVS